MLLHFRIAALKLFHVMIFEIELLKTATLPIKKKKKALAFLNQKDQQDLRRTVAVTHLMKLVKWKR